MLTYIYIYYRSGHYCVEGSHEPVRCDPGYYQDETGQSDCKLCMEGYYCDNTVEPVVMYNNSYCPEGYYCPNGKISCQ